MSLLNLSLENKYFLHTKGNSLYDLFYPANSPKSTDIVFIITKYSDTDSTTREYLVFLLEKMTQKYLHKNVFKKETYKIVS